MSLRNSFRGISFKSMSQEPEPIVHRSVAVGEEQPVQFCSNSIKTSKYELWNFLPKFLLEEFDPHTKVANCYFLLISAMQCLPAITNTNGIPTVLLPLTTVLLISGIFKAMEDYARHKADKAANSSRTQRLNRETGIFEEVLWSEVAVGDFVMVKTRETIPADMIVCQVAEPGADPKGLMYIETKSLDGETNLKLRHVLPCFLGKYKKPEELASVIGLIEMEHPNCLIDSFTGVIDVGGVRTNILPANVALRGCVLRSTEWMVGFVVNTGHEVKIMQTATEKKLKVSQLEDLASQQVPIVLILLFTICFTGATAMSIFNDAKNIDDWWYMNWNENAGKAWVIKFFYRLLLHASFIPVSLYVSMAIVRFFQARFMSSDLEMYYDAIDCPMQVRTMTLTEELGQVSHIFSDKTGTLTCNNMNFRKCSINGVQYGQGITEIGRAAWKLMGKEIPEAVLEAEEKAKENGVPHVVFYDPEYERLMETKERDNNDDQLIDAGVTDAHGAVHVSATPKKLTGEAKQRHKLKEFFRFLAVCHEVIAERVEGGGSKLSAPNPDDEALVCAAAYFGQSFKDRKEDFVVITDTDTGKDIEVEVLYSIDFTSTRKRMSVIIRDIDGRIKIVTKGADSMMFTRVDPADAYLISKTAEDVDQFSIEGLRCLVVGYKEIDEAVFAEWRKGYDAALTDLIELEKRKNGEVNQIDKLEDGIEDMLTVAGATAIEDRLQDGVPECIEKMGEAGIKVWVLTGDKEETAINIAVACNLVKPVQYMDHIKINLSIAPDVSGVVKILKAELARYEEDMEALPDHLKWTDKGVGIMKPRALIVDGPSLVNIMVDPRAKKLLLNFSQLCKSVVCCRVSPAQKREIVYLIKDGVEGVRTLAVGDGANDVAMINAAHIGVGIKGEEGVQAVNASDFAIGQFRFLSELLLKHGRFNYIRMSTLMSFMFYKNVMMSSTLFWYSFVNGFSGQKIFNEGAIQFFNLFYTSLPIVLYGTYDTDLNSKTVLMFPQLYSECIKGAYFSRQIFMGWVASALIESVLVVILPLLFMTNYFYGDGQLDSFWEVGTVTFTLIVLVVNMKIGMIQNKWYSLSFIIIALSVLSWIGIAYGIDDEMLIDYDFHGVMRHVMKSGTQYLVILIVCAIIALKDLAWLVIRRFDIYSNFHILQEMEQFKPYLLSGEYSANELHEMNAQELAMDPSEGRNAYKDRVANRDPSREPPEITLHEKQVICLAKRGVFDFLPVMFTNDLVHGTWYYLTASFLLIIAPVFPLTGVYVDLWPNDTSEIPKRASATIYVFLMMMGGMYTFGSAALIRSVEDPVRRPLMAHVSPYFRNDELLALWFYTIGTMFPIPITGMLCYFVPSNAGYWLAILSAIVAFFGMILLTISSYPSDEYPPETSQILVKFVKLVMVGFDCIEKKHIANDWIIGCWIILVACVGATIACIAKLVEATGQDGNHAVYDWSFAFVVMFLYTIGTMYFLAGSYPLDEEDEFLDDELDEELGDDDNDAGASNAGGGASDAGGDGVELRQKPESR